MLRTLLGAAAAVALAAAPVTAAPARAPRTAVATYTSPGGVAGILSGDSNVNGTRYGSATILTRAGETRLLEVSAADDNGLPVAFEIEQDTDGDGAGDVSFGSFCGKVAKPMRLKVQRGDVYVYIHAGQCAGGVSAPTTGTVTARLV